MISQKTIPLPSAVLKGIVFYLELNNKTIN